MDDDDLYDDDTSISNKEWAEIEAEHNLLLGQQFCGRDNKDTHDDEKVVEKETLVVGSGSGANDGGDSNNNDNKVPVQLVQVQVQVQVQVLQQNNDNNHNQSNNDNDNDGINAMIDVTEIITGMLEIDS